jgi:hypothetical protein
MQNNFFRNIFIYSIIVTTSLTGLLNFIAIPLLSEFFTNFFNLFSVSVALFLISIFIGVSNRLDIKFDAIDQIYISKVLSVILLIELIISLNFHFLDSIQDRIWCYAICLTPIFGFILSRPLVRLNNLEKVSNIIK